jgi:hypothetical protein
MAGRLAMMAGLLLTVASTVASIPGGPLPVSLAAPGLMVAGLVCGVLLIAVATPSRRARAREPAPVPPPAQVRPPAPPRRHGPDPSQEWVDALRPPGPPPVTGPIPVIRPPAGQEP